VKDEYCVIEIKMCALCKQKHAVDVPCRLNPDVDLSKLDDGTGFVSLRDLFHNSRTLMDTNVDCERVL
jgi:hypothetical protein